MVRRRRRVSFRRRPRAWPQWPTSVNPLFNDTSTAIVCLHITDDISWWPPSSCSDRLSEVGNALGLLKNDSGVVAGGGAGRLSLVGDPGVGPVGYAGAATAALFVAHDIAPLRAIHVAMGV